MLYYVQRSFIQPVGPITRLALLQRFAVCFLGRRSIMDASRYFDAMHNAMSTLHAGAQLLLTIRLQDTCGNDAYLEVKQLPGEQSALVCYSTMGRRCLNFQLFRKGWQLCRQPAQPDRLPRLLPGGSAGCRPHPAPCGGTGAARRHELCWYHPAECPHRCTDHSRKPPRPRRTLELLESGRFPLPAAGRNFVLAG